MLLRPRHAGRPWQGIRLVLDRGELRLENEMREVLASSSTLPALLDAVDGGVGEVAPMAAQTLAGLLRLCPVPAMEVAV